ncbi:MAG: response regulator transcription factor [Gemmatimonadaceae bacterium]|nr:response regulator transcription factor [Gemmatimonadaceae bacterium]
MTALKALSVRTPGLATTVFVVDDDIVVRESLDLLIRSTGWQPKTFDSAAMFLASPCDDVPGCLVLDVSRSEHDGAAVQRRIATQRRALPIIVITAQRDVPMAVRAMRAGAVDVLTKPLNDAVMLRAIEGAVEQSRIKLGIELELRDIRRRYDALSSREREVMALVVAGLLNKQVGRELGISEITVKAHRGRMMRKMKAGSVADLVKMAERLKH